MVCCMYYTDVFVGADNINNLKNALMAELPDFINNSNDLTQLVQGLCLFMGYPSCLCSLKANLDKSLQDISRKLNEDFKAVKSCVSIKTLNLNCSCNSKNILCKCCVISCIKELRDKCQCDCVKNASTDCKCQEPKEKCCKDFLSGLEACLSLLNLKTDLEGCDCDPKNCCKTGTCTQSCTVCVSSKSDGIGFGHGLGLLRRGPVFLAGKLEPLFGDRSSKGCQCGSGKSCCCLACVKDQCYKACNSECISSGQCPHPPGTCPRKTFCKALDGLKIHCDGGDLTCCSEGKSCHCQLEGSNCSGSGCCVETVDASITANKKTNTYHSVKCMIRRIVKFFNKVKANKNCPKMCCELLCVRMYCGVLGNLFKNGIEKGQDKCKKCNGKSTGNCTQGTKAKTGSCCGGNPSKCVSNSNSDPTCCQGCSECNAIKFRNALQTLQLSSPCGQDLWRTLDSFLYYCCNVFWPYVNKKEVKGKIEEAKKLCATCSKTSGTPCSCSPCLGCREIREKHNDIMAILRHGYVSSYVNSKWESLCKSGSPKCCGSSSSPSCSKCSPGKCPPGGCCEACPQRKAAKIFLGILPCLYWGLKILYDRSKYNSGFAGWNQKRISEASGLRDFLSAWGFDVSHLSSKNASDLPPILDILYGSSDSPGSFDKIYDFVSKKYFSHSLSSVPSSPPQTVRQMLLWLYGLRFQKHFSELVENCKSLCLPFGNSFNPDAFCYYIHTCSFILPVSVISVIQCPDGSPSFLPSHSEWKSFCYPSDPSDLLEKFCEYVRKIFVALAFLYYQCKNDRNSAGWNDCAFGQRCAEKFQEISSTSGSSSPSCSCANSGAYLCTAINKDPVHDHCNGSASTQNSCLGFGSTVSCEISKNHPQSKSQGKTCTPCPHPLQRFLCHGSDSLSQNYPFGLSGIVPMGFSKNYLPSPGKKGWSLYYVLKVFCLDGFYPLTRLVQFILCISQRPPETLLDLYAFFKKFVEALNSKPDLSSTFVQWIDGEPGRFLGKALKDAVRGLYGSQDSHSTSHIPANLFSLSECHAKKESGASCGPYLYPLTDNVSGVFTKELCSMYLSWICYRGPTFYSEFKDFHAAAQKKFLSCCLTSCTKIVECPCALPFIYSLGFQFNSPKTLSCPGHSKHNGTSKDCTLKSCSDFLKQLEKVVKGDPFKALLRIIDEFIWHIRLPFVYAFLYIWIIVISYFYYVQFYKLDLLHIDSHLHLPRSFKILPSTLFSDASSKLKDLSYFTL